MLGSRFAALAAAAVSIIGTGALAQRSTPLQLLPPTGAANDRFGFAVAVDGDTMIVGASQDDVGANADQGSAHVYRWTGSGWVFETTLTAGDGAAGDFFGIGVTLLGDTALVGARNDDVGANADQGSVYVFTRSGTVWTQQAKLTASDGAAGDYFGFSVAFSGETAIIGAHWDDIASSTNQGSVYVFTRSGTTWSEQAKLIVADGVPNDNFGYSVAVFGETAVVGAYTDDVGANTDQGSAYVFTRSGTTWTQQAKLTAFDGAALDNFGVSISISGESVLVGVWNDDIGANSNQGSAYVFTRNGTTWTQQAKLTAADGAAFDVFGWSLVLSGDTVLIGSRDDDVGTNADQGSAYVFTRSGTTWTEQARLTAPDGAPGDFFGFSLALSSDTAVVGAYFDSVGAIANQGSAWVFSRVGTRWIGPDLKLLASDGAASDRLGFSVSLSGDTAVVGAHTDDVGANTDQGSAYIFTRSGTTWTQQTKLTASDGAATDRFGISVSLSGDTAVVGAYFDDVGANTDQGSVYVFTRSGTTWTQQAKLTASDGAANDQFGNQVALSGDTAVVGAYRDDAGANTDQGSAYIFTRSGTTWTQQAKLTAFDGAAGDLFGYSVATFGETAVVGAYTDDVGAIPDQGSAYVFTRSGTTWTQQAQLTASDGASFDNFGIAISISGETVLVGVWNDDIGANSNQGSTYVFTRSGTIWTQQAELTAADGAASDFFGFSVALSGDTAIVAARDDDVGTSADQGSVYVFTRNGTIWTQQAKFTAADGAAGDQFGLSVALSGDTAVVGAHNDDVGANTDQGSAWIYDVPADDFSLAHNDVIDWSYPTLAAALLPATTGQQITATEAAWRSVSSLNTFGRSLGFFGSGDIRTPSNSVLDLSGSSALAADIGSNIEIFGQLRSAGFVNLTADAFTLGSRATLTARTNSSLTINAPAALLQGQTRLEQGATVTFSGVASAFGPTTCGLESSLAAGGTFTNFDTFALSAGTLSLPLFDNRSALNIFGSSAVFGSFTNNIGAATTIRSGTLFVFGSLTNNGSIVGIVCSGCLETGAAATPGLDVGGALAIGPDANLILPFADAVVRVGGHYDCAINSNNRYDMLQATLRLEGIGTEQLLEAMSTDIGPSPTGLDRTLAGHYPVGTLEIGPAPSTVRLVDARDNDGLGQSACEAIYVQELRIGAGSRLANTGCVKIYYSTLVNSGTVDVPGNLVALAAACPGDFNNDNFVDDADFVIFANSYNLLDCADPAMPAGCPADLNGDTFVDDADFVIFADAYNALLCP
jgi:hypothetical protein